MDTKTFLWTLASILLLSSVSDSQLRPVTLQEKIENSSLILVGEVQKAILVKPFDLSAKIDAVIIPLKPIRFLRGDTSLETVEIFDPLRGSHFGRLLILENKRYLFFLHRIEPDSHLVSTYNLQGRIFYYPYVGDIGAIDLAEKEGQDELQKTEQLLSLLPPVPDPTIPVAVLLDSLVAQKHLAFEDHWIGDKNFVNELDNHLENAQKHLVRLDSTKSYDEIKKFQDKIRREHNVTEAVKKKEPRNKRFVTREGYLLLYYNAQYILDRLPKRR